MKNVVVIVSMLMIAVVASTEPRGKIVCFGDSITYGAGVEGFAWPELIALKSNNIKIINAGRKGRKTADTSEFKPVLQAIADADYILILLGVNDLKDGNDSLVSECVKNVGWMIENTRKMIPNAKIFILSPPTINLETMNEINRNKKYNHNTLRSLEQLNNEYKKLADEKGVGFISVFGAVSPENYLDGLHPDKNGQKEIADKIWQNLNKRF